MLTRAWPYRALAARRSTACGDVGRGLPSRFGTRVLGASRRCQPNCSPRGALRLSSGGTIPRRRLLVAAVAGKHRHRTVTKISLSRAVRRHLPARIPATAPRVARRLRVEDSKGLHPLSRFLAVESPVPPMRFACVVAVCARRSRQAGRSRHRAACLGGFFSQRNRQTVVEYWPAGSGFGLCPPSAAGDGLCLRRLISTHL